MERGFNRQWSVKTLLISIDHIVTFTIEIKIHQKKKRKEKKMYYPTLMIKRTDDFSYHEPAQIDWRDNAEYV